MKITLTADEVREACAMYVRSKYENLRGATLAVQLHRRQLTPQEEFDASHGYVNDMTDRVEAVVDA